jgi:hypothetical protein
MRTLLRDTDRRQMLARAGRVRAEMTFDVRRVASEIAKLYESVA